MMQENMSKIIIHDLKQNGKVSSPKASRLRKLSRKREISPNVPSPMVDRNVAKQCALCLRAFKIYRNGHYCRICGRKVCDNCSRSKVKLMNGKRRAQRACNSCAKDYVKKMPDTSEMMEKPRRSFQSFRSKVLFSGSVLQLHHFVCFYTFLLLTVVVTYSKFVQRVPLEYVLCAIVSLPGYIVGLVGLVAYDTYQVWSVEEKLVRSKGFRTVEGDPRMDSQSDESSGNESMEDDEQVPFSIVDLAKIMEDTCGEIPTVTIKQFILSNNGLAKFMIMLSRSTSLAAGTVKGYIEHLENGIASWPEHESGVQLEYTLNEIIERETELNIADVGKKNPSLSRCILRLSWMIEFVHVWLRLCYIDGEHEDCGTSATTAYEQTLGKHHSWFIRKGVVATLGSVPTKTQFYTGLDIIDEQGEADITQSKAIVTNLQENMQKLYNNVYQLLEEKDLLEIK